MPNLTLMSSINNLVWLRKLKLGYEAVMSVASLVWGVTAISLFVYWYWVQQPELPTVRTMVSTQFVNQGEGPMVKSPIQFGAETKKFAYDVWITDDIGRVVFTYPTVVIDRSHSENDPASMTFKFPALPEGSYAMHMKAWYPLNPIRPASIDMEMARVIVGATNQRGRY